MKFNANTTELSYPTPDRYRAKPIQYISDNLGVLLEDDSVQAENIICCTYLDLELDLGVEGLDS